MIDGLTAATFLVFLLGIAFWVALKYVRVRLRLPPSGFQETVVLARESDAPIPSKFRTPQLRRQLILASSRPAELTNLLSMSVKTLDLTKVSKKPLIYGFLHPNADAGGGGERVLWAAIKTLVSTDPKAVAAIYVTAKKGVTQASLLQQAASRFGIKFDAQEANRIVLIALTQTRLVDPDVYPILTLLGQAIGMMILGYEAISNLMPDVFIDTTGLAFSYPVVSYLAKVPILTYTHYPFIQSEMLQSIRAKGLLKPKLMAKFIYWKILSVAYNWAGSFANVVSVNSTWTKQHLGWRNAQEATIVYPPVAVQDFAMPTGADRSPAIVYVAQFRPEKRHEMVVKSFAKARALARKDSNIPSKARKPHLILIGSVRNEEDALRVQSLRVLAAELMLGDQDYTIVENAPWSAVKQILQSSLIGLNAMWNEHFGMGVVEIMAAGLIPVVHASAGPLLDIVKDDEGTPGFFFRSNKDPDGLGLQGYPLFSEAILKALALSPSEQHQLSIRAYNAAQRFSDAAFMESWRKRLDVLEATQSEFARQRKAMNLFD